MIVTRWRMSDFELHGMIFFVAIGFKLPNNHEGSSFSCGLNWNLKPTKILWVCQHNVEIININKQRTLWNVTHLDLARMPTQNKVQESIFVLKHTLLLEIKVNEITVVSIKWLNFPSLSLWIVDTNFYLSLSYMNWLLCRSIFFISGIHLPTHNFTSHSFQASSSIWLTYFQWISSCRR